MDCEKFEAAMIDELYDELDELTSAAMKRHAAGCARCAARMQGLRATRRVAVLPLEEASADLEDRILAAAKDAQKVIPIEGRFARGVSRAGSWAMQPQTAMAAVFLLMIGSGLLFFRARYSGPPSAVSVMERGAPAASAAAAPPPTMITNDSQFAESAHGASEPRGHVADSVATATAATPTAPLAQALGGDDLAAAPKVAAPVAAPAAAPPMASAYAMAPSRAVSRYSSDFGESNAGMVGGAPASAGGAANHAVKKGESEGDTGFSGAMTAYRSRSFDEATRRFDALAAGDVNAALWAARSVRDGNGCGAAVGRFDQVWQRAPSATAGYDARLEGGRCYRTMGSFEAARARLVPLITVPSHAARAQQELDAMAASTPRAAAKPSPSPAPPQQMHPNAATEHAM